MTTFSPGLYTHSRSSMTSQGQALCDSGCFSGQLSRGHVPGGCVWRGSVTRLRVGAQNDLCPNWGASQIGSLLMPLCAAGVAAHKATRVMKCGGNHAAWQEASAPTSAPCPQGDFFLGGGGCQITGCCQNKHTFPRVTFGCI